MTKRVTTALVLLPALICASQTSPKGFTEQIPGTLVKFDMIHVDGGPVEVADPANPGKTIAAQVKPFAIGKTEVTWDEYDNWAFGLDLTEEQKAAGVEAQSRPSKPYGTPDRGYGHHGFAALGMTYNAAQRYCEWLSAKTGKKYRVPSEAEWLLAAGKPVGTSELADHAWSGANSENKAHPVASKKPNALGLYDVFGNTAEWVTGVDGKPCVRGGSFRDKAEAYATVPRATQIPMWNMNDPQMPKSKWWLSNGPFVGFRLVCEE